MYNLIFLFIFIFFSGFVYAQLDNDQWQDSEKTYKDLIDEGFEVKAYDTSTIKTDGGLFILFFVRNGDLAYLFYFGPFFETG